LRKLTVCNYILGPQFPSFESLLEERNRVFARHPETQFVSLHMGWPENLDWVSRMLDEHPNVMVEFGAREAELGRQPRRTRELFLKYQDRVMFGTDNGMDEAMYRNQFAGWKPDNHFDPCYRGRALGKIYGMDLPIGTGEDLSPECGAGVQQFKGGVKGGAQ
jgi:hypothetical protein